MTGKGIKMNRKNELNLVMETSIIFCCRNAENNVGPCDPIVCGMMIKRFFIRTLYMFMFGVFSIVKGQSEIIDTNLIFRALEINPSPNGLDYEGIFEIVNNTGKTVKIPLLEKQMGKKIRPANTIFQIFTDGKWIQEKSFGGILAPNGFVESGEICKLFIDISLKEQPTPVTVRVGFIDQDLWSQAFVLNWKKDREIGRAHV